MTKDELTALVAHAAEVPQRAAARVVDELFEALAGEVALAGECRLPGLGTLRRIPVAAASGRNPRTGEALVVPAHHKARFRPSKTLKARLAQVPLPPQFHRGIAE
jgi:DNA-binding protein HU-beta